MVIFLILSAISFTQNAFAGAQSQFSSPNGVTEVCRALPPMAGADYSEKDIAEETEFCGYDFYTNPTIALCPKTWSTSPGTMIYDISKSGLSQSEYEAQKSCGGSKSGHDSITKYKQSMNQSGTSGTYSPSSIVYYHLSRFLGTTVEIPVAVYRSMDRQAHFDRVTRKAHENKMGKGEMIRTGWEWLYRAEKNPDVYQPPTDLFTDDDKQIFGVLVDGGGERYGAEINGLRTEDQNKQFQQTPAYYALRENTDLATAIQRGLEKAKKNSAMKKALGPSVSDFQMSVWMKELSEIVVLDYMLSQQDRVGNIDYKWYVYWVDAQGKTKSKKWEPDSDNVNISRANMANLNYPKQMDGFATEFVQRTRINDNDAGARYSYANRAKRSGWLKDIYHFSPDVYEKLKTLSADFKAKGELYQYLSNEFNLSDKDVEKIVENTVEVFEILKGQCAAGVLRFDLYGPKKVLEGKNTPSLTTSCN
jgi:hypothetical protein